MDHDDVTIIMPHEGKIHPDLQSFITEACLKGATVIAEQQGEKVKFPNNPARARYTNINITRNRARERALRTAKREWFLYVDSDVIPPKNAIEMFKFRSSANKCHVMGGWYPVRGEAQKIGKIEDGVFSGTMELTRWVAGKEVEDNLVHQYYCPRTYKDMVSNVAPLGCLWIRSEVSASMRFMPGMDMRVRDAYVGHYLMAGDCCEFGIRLKRRYGIEVLMNQAVVCRHN